MDSGNYDRRPPPAYEQIRVLEDENEKLRDEIKDYELQYPHKCEQVDELRATVERLEKAIQRHKAETEEKLRHTGFKHCVQDRELWAALEGKDE